MEWTSNTNNKKLKLLVVAIDIGATYSGCSCLTKVDFEKCKAGNNLSICFPIWKGVGESSRKAPTSVLFRPNKTFHSFGFDAEQYYKENSGTLEFKEWYFFKNFKTKLNIVKGVLIKDTIKEHNKEAGRSMKALDVFGSVIKYYKDHILQCFKDRPYYLNDIHWVITVPPSWGFKAKQLMKDAADQAGIYNDQLTLALEPEAACSYCPVSAESTTDVGKAIAEMQIGEQVIVCNSGGATTDLTVYEVTGPKMLKKIDQAYGGHYGGNTVNAELFKILTILFSGPVIKEIRDKYPSEYLDFLTNIEHKLTSFYVHKEPMVTIRVPLEWKVGFEHCTGEILEEALLNSSYKRKVYLYGDKLRINNDIFRQFIDFSTNYVLGLIKELFRKPATTNVTTLLAVGDDFELSILINAITQKFPNLTVIVPEDPDIAVLKGAVLYGFEPYKFTRMEHEEKGEKLAETLRGLGLEDVIDLQDIFNENYQKSFWNRVYLVGPHSVGKSCLAKILVGEPVPGTRQSTDGIWIYMGKAGMDIDKMEWVFFPKGNAITEVLTNMLMSMSTYEEERNGKDSFVDVPLYESTQTNERVKFDGSTETIQISSQIVSASHDIDTYETLHTMKDQQLEENSSSDFDLEDHIHQNTSLINQKEKDASCIEKNKEKKQNFKVVSNNSECEWMKEITANMSPDKIHELIVKAVQEGKYKQMIVPIDIWDFGGQKDYYMTHQLFITSRGIFVLMFNGSIGLHQHMPGLNFLPGHFGKPTVAVYLLHWVNSILTYCNRTDDGFPKIIFVATHKDEKWFQWTQEARRTHLENELQQLFETHGGLKHLEFKPLIFVDATNPDDAEITDLRERIMQRATEHPRWGEAMPTRWIPLELLLAQKSAEGTNIISYDQLLVLNSKNESMILSERQLATFLKVQHSLGKLLYFDVENLRGFIILSPAYLVEVLRSIVTEKQFWPKGEMYSKILINLQETGMIERDDIYYLWQQDDFKHIMSYKEYMIQILVHLDVFIAPKTSLENLNVSIQDVSHFLVPCMITKENDTMFLKRFRHSNSSIVIAYTFIEEVIPPALSYRFLSSLIASWDIKNYKGKYREKRMLFSDLAVVKIDNFHDVAVQVKTNKIIVSLIHAKTKEDIIPTLASSLQECLTVTIVGISKFYSKLSEGVPSQNEKSAVPFNIEFGVFCESDMCFFNHNEMSMSTGEPIWMCKKHKQRHTIKFLSIWFSEKETREYEPNIDVCTSFCSGLGRLEMERCPLPHHVRRLTAQLSIDECREIAIMLGSKLQEWDDLVYEFERQPANDLKFISLWSCIMKSVNFSFGSLQMILEKKGRSAHLLCELFRDVKIDVSEELLKMYNEKCDRVLMPKEKLNIIISRFNILCESETIKRTRDDYNLLSRYEVLQIAGLEKLIRKRKTEEDPILYFVSLEETFDVIKKSHSALNHAGRDKMQKELNKKYANVTLSAINLYKSMCEECQLRRKNPAKGVVVKPILSKEFNSRGQVDLIDMQSMPDGDFKFIMNYQDHLTKFGVIESLSSKRAAEVAYKLLTNVFLVFGAPHILQSDNGREFTANIILELKQLWPELVIVHGKPRHPQSQGSVERSNGDVHDMLVSWMRDNKTTKWATGIKFVQFQKNRRNHSGIKRSPYEAMFGCPPKGIQRERHASGSNLSKQAEKMVARSNQILRPVQVGDNVTVPIPSVDRGRGDPRNLLCIVLEHDQTNDQFKLGSKDGILNGSYSRNQFTFSPIHSLALQDANTLVELSVREAARQQSIGDGQGFLKCACKTGCVRKTCKCVKSNVLCNSRCHNSLSCHNK